MGAPPGNHRRIPADEFATFLKDLHKGRFQMFDIGWIADYPDPENFLDILFHSESSNNHTHYSNPEVDALLMKARVETDETARYALYNQAEQKSWTTRPGCRCGSTARASCW